MLAEAKKLSRAWNFREREFNIAFDSINIDLNNSTFIHEWNFIERIWNIDGNKRWIFSYSKNPHAALSRGKSVEDEKYHQLKDSLIFHLASILHVPKREKFYSKMKNIHGVLFPKDLRRMKVEEFASRAQKKERKFKGTTNKWCWNEKMRKSTSQRGFMRFHQLLKRDF